nr:MAG TPA: hypothetical protein [Caudoviricetes sp.]
MNHIIVVLLRTYLIILQLLNIVPTLGNIIIIVYIRI